jgi:hypothetical protein
MNFFAILFILAITFLIGYRVAGTVKDEQRFMQRLVGKVWLLLPYLSLSGLLLGFLFSRSGFTAVVLVILFLNFGFGASMRRKELPWLVLQPVIGVLIWLIR